MENFFTKELVSAGQRIVLRFPTGERIEGRFPENSSSKVMLNTKF